MFETITYKNTTVINRKLKAEDLQNVIELYSTELTSKEIAYREAGYHVEINRYIKSFKATIDINSTAEVEIPEFNELATNLEINTALRNLEWKSPRKHLNLMLQTDGLNWNRKGTVSLVNRGDLPYVDADLMAFFTEGLAIEAGEVAKLGVQIQDVGFGWIAPLDDVLIYANVVKEVTIVNTSDNLEQIAGLDLQNFGLSLLEQEDAASIRTLLGLAVPVVIARRDTDLTIPNSVAATTDISFNSEVLDLYNAWDGTSFVVSKAGIYSINVNCQFSGSGGTITASDHFILIRLNSTIYNAQRILYASATPNAYLSVNFPIPAFLNVGDVLKIQVASIFSGATVNKLAAATVPTTLIITQHK